MKPARSDRAGVKVFVVRHVKAGERKKWKHAPDEERPISKAGAAQATAIADRLAGEQITQLYSSPYVRCVQSLEPLGERLGVPVIADTRIEEGVSFESSLALLRDVADGAVLCSHGDVIPDLIMALARRGMELLTEPDWRKATIWVLEGPGERSDEGDWVFTSAAVEHPPRT